MSTLSAEEAYTIQNEIESGVEELDLRETLLSREAAEIIITALARPSEVRMLDMASSKIHGLSWVEKGIRAFTGWATGNSSLRAIDLSSNSLGDGGCEILVDALRGAKGRKLCPNIDTLILDTNSLRDRAATSIAALLATSTSLTRLSLQHNELSNTGAEAICDAVEGTRGKCRLGHLHLAHNLIGSKGISALQERLELETCDLTKNLVSSVAVQRLRHSQTSNSSTAIDTDLSATNRSVTSTPGQKVHSTHAGRHQVGL